MDESEAIKKIEKRAFRVYLQKLRLKILVSILAILVTATLFIYYSSFEHSERIKFLIILLWPSGIILVLLPWWTRLWCERKKNIRFEIYKVVRNEIKEMGADKKTEMELLSFVLAEKHDLTSLDILSRREALKRIIKELQENGWGK